MSTRAEAGFTLLEMLVALAIFGLLAVMAYGGLKTVLDQQSRTEQQSEHMARLQLIYQIMKHDIEQVVPRGVRNEFGDELPSLAGGGLNSGLEFTHGGWRNPAGYARSTLQRVGYGMEENRLMRWVWPVLDRAQDTEPTARPLYEGIEEIRFRYLDEANAWQEQWPPVQISSAPAQQIPLPRAVEILIDFEELGPVTWLFRMPQ
jgi:general secretion pathway protein J